MDRIMVSQRYGCLSALGAVPRNGKSKNLFVTRSVKPFSNTIHVRALPRVRGGCKTNAWPRCWWLPWFEARGASQHPPSISGVYVAQKGSGV